VADLLGEALRSLRAQTVHDWEGVVVDDGDPEVAKAFAPFAGDRRLRLLKTDNCGLATARNRAIAASRSPFLALLDGDDQLTPGYLEQMIPAIAADDGLAFVTCDAEMFGDPRFAGRRYSDAYPLKGAVTLNRVLRSEQAIFVASIIRRSALDEVGGFDGQLRSVEDLDLWIRLLARGWRGAVLPRPLVRYRRRPGSLSTQPQGMLAAARVVYRKAAVALKGRPERAAALAALERCERDLRWVEGEAAILSGDVDRGLWLLQGAEGRSGRWRLALPLMRRLPGLAAPLLGMRTRLPRPRGAP
jgi:glycosyltransferase involved in cell wall biosynthesis